MPLFSWIPDGRCPDRTASQLQFILMDLRKIPNHVHIQQLLVNADVRYTASYVLTEQPSITQPSSQNLANAFCSGYRIPLPPTILPVPTTFRCGAASNCGDVEIPAGGQFFSAAWSVSTSMLTRIGVRQRVSLLCCACCLR